MVETETKDPKREFPIEGIRSISDLASFIQYVAFFHYSVVAFFRKFLEHKIPSGWIVQDVIRRQLDRRSVQDMDGSFIIFRYSTGCV